MIKKFDKKYESFCEKDVFGVRAFSFLNAYGTKQVYAHFWIQEDEDKNITSFISKIDYTVTLCLSELSDIEEIVEFIDVLKAKYAVLDSKYDVCFENKKKTYGNIMYHKKDNDILECPNFNIIKNDCLKDIYSILEDGDEYYSLWLEDILLRIEKNTCQTGLITENGVAKSCALKLSSTDNKMLLGSVKTVEDARHHGYAKAIISSLLKDNKEKDAYILCKDERVSFYEEQFFNKIGGFCEVEIS